MRILHSYASSLYSYQSSYQYTDGEGLPVASQSSVREFPAGCGGKRVPFFRGQMYLIGLWSAKMYSIRSREPLSWKHKYLACWSSLVNIILSSVELEVVELVFRFGSEGLSISSIVRFCRYRAMWRPFLHSPKAAF